MRARGHYSNPKAERIWIARNTKAEDDLIENHLGVVCAVVQVSHLPPKLRYLYPAWAQTSGRKLVWLWTPELRLYLHDKYLQIHYYVCALTATQSDPALREYANWALDELSLPNKDTKKSTLLSAYGMLALNIDTEGYRIHYAWAGSQRVTGTRVVLPLIHGKVTMREVKFSRRDENDQPSIVNVAARGVIEAETRTRSIEYARALEGMGVNVVQIYADALLINETQLPFIDPEWRVSHSLTDVIIPRPNGLISKEVSKLPGVPSVEARARAASARTPFPKDLLRVSGKP
jgi:hypothetical protein